MASKGRKGVHHGKANGLFKNKKRFEGTLRNSGCCRPISCPICLDCIQNELVATLCGHTFCWNCIYLHLVTSRDRTASLAVSDLSDDTTNDSPLDSSSSLSLYEQLQNEALLRSDEGAMARTDEGMMASLSGRAFRCPVCNISLDGIDALVPLYMTSRSSSLSLSGGAHDDADGGGIGDPPKLGPSQLHQSIPPYHAFQALHQAALRSRATTKYQVPILRDNADSDWASFATNQNQHLLSPILLNYFISARNFFRRVLFGRQARTGSAADLVSASGGLNEERLEQGMQAFLSRLLLCLGSFVVLCLLFF